MGPKHRRRIHVANLDPAAECFWYDVAFDIRDLITVEDVMEELQLGPNGGLVYCMEYLLQNKFISGSLLALSAMISLQLPHVNVLSKCDLVEEASMDRVLEMDSALQLWDVLWVVDTVVHLLLRTEMLMIRSFPLPRCSFVISYMHRRVTKPPQMMHHHRRRCCCHPIAIHNKLELAHMRLVALLGRGNSID